MLPTFVWQFLRCETVGSCRVILVVAYNFLPHILGASRNLYIFLSFCECKLSGEGDKKRERVGGGGVTQTLLAVIKFVWIYALVGNMGDEILLLHPLVHLYWYPHTQESPCESVTTFNCSKYANTYFVFVDWGSSFFCGHNVRTMFYRA